MKRIITIILAVMMLCSNIVFAQSELNINLVLSMNDAPGNIYFTGDTAKWNVDIINKNAEAMDLSIKFRAVGRKYKEVWTHTESILMTGYGHISKNFEFDMEKDFPLYDIYDLTITLTDGVSSKIFTNEFSYVRQGKRNERFGVNTHYLHVDYNKFSADNTIPLMKKSGVSIIRDSNFWSRYEQNGEYAFDPDFSHLLEKLEENDLEILFIFIYGNTDYMDNTMSFPTDATAMDAFARYAASVVQKSGRTYFEIWNEPNAEIFGIHQNPEIYVELVKKVEKAVHDVNPDAKLLGPTTSGAYNKWSGAWLDKTLECGLADYIDILTAHPYSHFYMPKGDTIENFLPDYISDYREAGEAYGIDEMWVSEDGESSASMSEDEQAEYLVKAYTINQMCGIDKYMWYDFVCDTVSWGNDVEAKFGMLNGINQPSPYSAKPVFLAMSAMNSKLAGKEYVENSELAENVYSHKFSESGNPDTYVMWSDSEKNLKMEFNSSALLKTDMYGNEEIIMPEDGIFTLIVNSEPTYYEPVELADKKFKYSYDQNTGLCSVEGYIDSKNKNVPVTINLIKPDKSINELTQEKPLDVISYFDQTETAYDGVYRFTFNPVAGEGIYLLKVSSSDGEKREYKLSMKSELSCEVSGKKPLSEYKNGEDIVCNVTINNPNTIYKEYDMYVALYKGNKLTGISKATGFVDDEAVQTTEVTVSATEGADSAKAFVWVKDSINALSNSATTN